MGLGFGCSIGEYIRDINTPAAMQADERVFKNGAKTVVKDWKFGNCVTIGLLVFLLFLTSILLGTSHDAFASKVSEGGRLHGWLSVSCVLGWLFTGCGAFWFKYQDMPMLDNYANHVRAVEKAHRKVARARARADNPNPNGPLAELQRQIEDQVYSADQANHDPPSYGAREVKQEKRSPRKHEVVTTRHRVSRVTNKTVATYPAP